MSTTADPEVTTLLSPPTRSRWLWWAVGGGVLALSIVGIAVSTVASSGGPAWETASAARGPLVVTVEATGTLEAADSVEVGSEVSGRLIEVNVDYNDIVKAGQVLARIDPQQLQASVDQAAAQLMAAEAAVAEAAATSREAQAAADRAEREAARGLISTQDLEARRASAARGGAGARSASANAVVSRAKLVAAEDQLAKAVVVSPIDGVVLDRHVSVGQTVTAGFETPVLFDIARDLSQMELVVDIDEADVARVREGQTATFTVDALPGQKFRSTVVQLRYAPQTTDNVVTYEAVLSVDNAERLLRPGMTAAADIVVAETEDALVVPSEALRFDPDGAQALAVEHVWTLREGRPVALPVRIGLTDGEHSEIASGLTAGDIVVLGAKEAE